MSVAKIFIYINGERHVVGTCYHGMTRPQVADRGTASDKIEKNEMG